MHVQALQESVMMVMAACRLGHDAYPMVPMPLGSGILTPGGRRNLGNLIALTRAMRSPTTGAHHGAPPRITSQAPTDPMARVNWWLRLISASFGLLL